MKNHNEKRRHRIETRLSNLEAVSITDDFIKNTAEVEAWFKECQRQFASPEETEKRRIWYENLLAKGEELKRKVYADLQKGY